MSIEEFVQEHYAFAVMNSITLPVYYEDEEEIPELKGYVMFMVPITILLENAAYELTKKAGLKSLEDQPRLYTDIENRISSQWGIDGRPCLLRFICELQTKPIADYSMVGEILTLLFTPRWGNVDLLLEYLTAEKLGKRPNVDCSSHYDCPLSVFNYLSFISNITETQEEAEGRGFYDTFASHRDESGRDDYWEKGYMAHSEKKVRRDMLDLGFL